MKWLYIFIVSFASCQGFPGLTKHSDEENVYIHPSFVTDTLTDPHLQDRLIQDDKNDEDMLSVRKLRRETTVQLKSPGIGTLSQKGTIVDNRSHQLNGMGFVTKDFTRKGFAPDAFGGSLGYVNKPTGSNLGIGADSIRGYGTDLSASGRLNLLQLPNGNFGVSGHYGRHFGHRPPPRHNNEWGVFAGTDFWF
ncbi:uncharacterized protein LOC143194711 isoform X1 [Rhynchophorus ferrugineus]|uniref:uncharacterized protein LOC143194711 isoform X1 n=1 Tax=Rhynchophorus ferrugineus TaxID=354439 RepID=UPI003FCDF3C7